MTSTIGKRFRTLELTKQVVMWVTALAICTFAFTHRRGHVVEVTIWSLVAITIALAVVALVVQRILRCPRCHGDLRNEGADSIQGKQITSCPHCGLGIDETGT
jgi:hypothetical protein